MTSAQSAADFEQFWQQIAREYAYFAKKRLDWSKVRAVYSPRAAAVTSKRELLHVLEDAIAELYDDHATLGADAPGSPNIVPSRADLWGSWHGDAAIIDEVRPGSIAEATGVRNGDRVLTVADLPVEAAVQREMPHALTAPDPRARDWALRRVLAGRRGQARDFSVRHASGITQAIHLPALAAPTASADALLQSRLLDGGIGYIRFHNSLGNPALVEAFDAALNQMKAVPAILLDLRDTPGGGNNNVAEPILGRFIERSSGYQKFVVPGRGLHRTRSFVQKVKPRGPFAYRGTLIVLVDHWTASMAEGMAVGLAAMGRATVVGTAMAGLNGGVYTRRLTFSGIPYNYPAERIYALDGTPRETFVPNVTVSPSGEVGIDVILTRALAVAKSGLAEAR